MAVCEFGVCEFGGLAITAAKHRLSVTSFVKIALQQLALVHIIEHIWQPWWPGKIIGAAESDEGSIYIADIVCDEIAEVADPAAFNPASERVSASGASLKPLRSVVLSVRSEPIMRAAHWRVSTVVVIWKTLRDELDCDQNGVYQLSRSRP